MGNEQSAPTPRKPPNKLSKPRTNNNSNLNLLNSKSAPGSRRNSVSTTNNDYPPRKRDSKLPPSEAGSVAKRKDEPTQKKRLSLFRSRSEKVKDRAPEIDSRIGGDFQEPYPVDQPSHRWSRQPAPRGRGYSFVTEPVAEDLHYDPAVDLNILRTRMSFHQAQAAQYEQQLNRLSLVAELPSPPLPQYPQPEPKGVSRRNSIYDPEENGTQPSIAGSRRNSDAEKYGPIRRRSLLQHGIATRPAFVESDPRRSLPSQAHAPDNLQSHYFSPIPPTFPPAKLPVLGPNPAFATPGPRTETPTDMDYRHIGAYKLGSLRITNGAASPTPSRDGRASSLGNEDDYVTPGPGRRSIEKEKEQRHGLSQRSNTLSVPAEARRVPWVVRTESPLRQALDSDFEPLSINIPDPSFALFDFQSTEVLFKSTHSPTKSLELAHEYQQEIASSPFSFENSPLPSPRFSPRLESTSKHTAIEDDLFAPEPDTPNLEATPRMPRSFDSGYEGGPVRKPKGPREKDPKPLAKADSGYSSIVSLRSFKKDASPAVPPKDSPPAPIHETFVRVPSSTYSVNSSIGPETGLQSKRSLPALPVEQIAELPSEPVSETPQQPLKTFPYELYAPLPAPPVLRQSIEPANTQPHLQIPKTQSKRKSLPAIANTAREMREDSPADSEKSVSSSASSSIWQRKKLAKRVSRPSSFQPQPEPVFTVQAFRSPSEVLRIPVPSVEIRRHLDERVELFPVATFANTSSGTTQLRRTASKETLGTIFSVGSAEVRDELSFARLQGALPAIPTEATIPEDSSTSTGWVPRPDFNKRHTFQPSAPMPAPAEDWISAARKSFQLPTTRDRSRDRNLVPAKEPLQKQPAVIPNTVPAPVKETFQRQPAARYPTPAPVQERSPRKSFQQVTKLDRSPERSAPPMQKRPSRESFQKPPARNPSPAPIPDWNPRRSFQKPASRDPSPNTNMRASLQLDFETHITSFDAISSSLGRSPYELALDTIPSKSTPSVSDRAKSMTAQFEADAAQRFANSRSASQESHASTIMRPRRSYESIKNSNPWSGDNRSQPRLSMRGPPPQAHANGRRPYSFQQALSRESLPSYGRQFNSGAGQVDIEPTIQYQKAKVAPPVSMSTQRKSITSKKSQVFAPDSLQTSQAAPSRTPPQPPAPVNPLDEADAWKISAGAWAERKKSAGEALSARTSLDMSRPPSMRSSFQQARPQEQELRARKSMDASSYGESLRRAESARPSMEYDRPHVLHGGKSFDTSQRQTSWNYNNNHDSNIYAQQSYGQVEYNHTYGSSDYTQQNKENYQKFAEPEYYETEPEYQQQAEHLPETFHQRKTSTSDMLVLDRFSGGLDYGYEPGLGLVGSAGTRTTGKMGNAGRKSVRESLQYGVDFSDVPVILQRVRVRG